jgi:hypothetical protein
MQIKEPAVWRPDNGEYKEPAHDSGELLNLALVIAAALVFTGTLAWVPWRDSH